MEQLQRFLDRVPSITDWKGFIFEVCEMANAGKLKEWVVVESGLEDLNIKVTTAKGKYLLKVFASNRTKKDIERIKEVYAAITSHNIAHPKLLNFKGGVVHELDGEAFCMYEWVTGSSFYDLNEIPNSDELKEVVAIAAELNSIHFKPTFIQDNWAVGSLPSSYDQLKNSMSTEDRILVEKAKKLYESIDHEKLPKAFVHGDITQQNLIKSTEGKIYLIDFSVCNYYPRIQEISLIASLLMDKNEPLKKRLESVIKEYSKHIELTQEEINASFAYAVASQAMEIIGSLKERVNGNNIDELDYWLNIGRQGLKESIGSK